MFMIMYGQSVVAYVQGKSEALKTLKRFKQQNPNSDMSLWGIRSC